MEDNRIYPWALLAVVFAAERGYQNASQEEREQLVQEFIDFMESKL